MNVALGKLIEAYAFYHKASLLAEEESESDDTKAMICIKQQSCAHAQGKNQEALDNLLPLLKKSTLSLSVLGLLKRSLGNVYRSAANWHLGEKYLSEAVEIAKSLGDVVQVNEWRCELGRVYRSAGLYKKALDLQKEAYEAALARGDIVRLAIASGCIGFTNYSLVVPNCNEAIKFLGTRFLLSKIKLKDEEGVRWCLNNIGKVYLSLKDVQPAIMCFKKSLELVRGTGNLLGEGTALGNLGSALREAEKYYDAIIHHREYLKNASQRLDAGGEAIMLYELAVDYVLLKDFVNARDYALKAVVKLRDIHSRLTQEDDQLKIANFEKNQSKTFNLLQHVLSEIGQYDVALFISELGRARTLADLMQTKLITVSKITYGVSKFIKDDASIDESLVCDLCCLLKVVAAKLKSTLVVYSLVDIAYSDRGKKQQWIFTWVISPSSSKVIFSKKLIKSDELRNFQLDEDYLGGLRREIGVSHQETFAECIIASSDRRDIKLSKAKTTSSPKQPVSDATTPTEQLDLLYNILIDPVVDRLQFNYGSDPPRLILVPHRIIFGVPFAALRRNNNYLIEQFILSQVASLSILDQLVELKNNPAQSKSDSVSEAFVIGNPVMPHDNICQLPGSEEEAKTVHKIMGGKLLLNEQVTKAAVVQNLPLHSIIHLATHATIADSIVEHLQEISSEIEGDYSTKGAIVLSKSNALCSGILTSTEVQNLSLSCELMTLSCCRTACGKITGDGVLGLSRAVLLAGASCFIATLWAIEDVSTSKLMEVFYSHYKECQDAPKAMRIAILALLNNGHKIAYWAAFCVSGVSPGML